ncbi:MAG: hypothetical protein PHR26_01540 [Candidatus ainarchaeum sp.]|nr:hypothetical protein [Candidatus ainarchaeum sp.]MDD3976329.1 hypothetical protein [Candidatus ainarchaeum sp.]
MIKNIGILGINNFLGLRSLEFFKKYSKKYKISAVSFDNNCDNLDDFIQILKDYSIEYIFVEDKSLIEKIEIETNATVYTDYSLFIKSVKIDEIVCALSGILSVKYILSAIYEFKDINLLNTSPLLYSGKIIPKEAKLKGVKLKVYSYPAYSLDWFLSNKNLSDISKISLFTTVYKEKDIYPKEYTVLLEYIKKFYSINKIRLASDLFIINYMYDIPLEKFWFYEQSMRFISVAVRFKDGSNVIHSASKNIDSMFNFYFIKNRIILEDDFQYEDISLRINKFNINKYNIFKISLDCLKKKGTLPILFYLICEFFCISNFYNKFLKNTKLINILKDVLENSEFYDPYPDLSTIYALDKKVKEYISNKYFKKTK